MTSEACMAWVDTLSPNHVPEMLKLRWLAELEGHVLVNICHHDPEALAFRGEEGEAVTLSVPFPFDRIYLLYLTAMVDYYHGDLSRYHESAALFEAAWEDYVKWYKRERRE